MEKYTFFELIVEVLSKQNRPLSSDEIWQKATEYGLDRKLGTKGKTPSATIAARIYTEIKDSGDNSTFKQVSKRPARFMLTNSLMGNNKTDFVLDETPKKENSVTIKFHERDLHPLLAKFVYSNQHFKCYVKTIYHENSAKKTKGANEWLHPDLVGVYFPFHDYVRETTDLQKSLNVNPIRLFSFEMKKELNYSNLRECYFQAVSNSSWANEGYLVCLDINEEPDFKNEIQRLSKAFGIGIIKLNAENIFESEMICSANYHDVIDWDTLNRLAEVSNDFKKFLSDIKDDLKVDKVRSNYDIVLKDEEYEEYLRKKGICENSK